VGGVCVCLRAQEVLRLSRELALRTLQLEMEYAYRALEDEAMDIVGFDVNGEARTHARAALRMAPTACHSERHCALLLCCLCGTCFVL